MLLLILRKWRDNSNKAKWEKKRKRLPQPSLPMVMGSSFLFYWRRVFSSFLHFFPFKIFNCCSVTVVCNFPSLPPSAQPTSAPIVNSYTVVRVHGSFIQVLCLVTYPSFRSDLPPHTPPTPCSCRSVPCFCASGFVFLGVYFVH